jgi:hypothetical protein
MLLGIAGTDGAGKGEKRIRGASQDLEHFLRKVYSDCKSPVPDIGGGVTISQFVCY